VAQPDIGRKLKNKVVSYRGAFEGNHGERVLADLATFCHASKTTHVMGDPYGSAQLEGRRQVWLRIREGLDLTDAQINRYMFEATTEE